MLNKSWGAVFFFFLSSFLAARNSPLRWISGESEVRTLTLYTEMSLPTKLCFLSCAPVYCIINFLRNIIVPSQSIFKIVCIITIWQYQQSNILKECSPPVQLWERLTQLIGKACFLNNTSCLAGDVWKIG